MHANSKSFHSIKILSVSSMENIFTASKTFYWLAKLLGLLPMSFDGPFGDGKFMEMETKWYDVVGCVVPLSVVIFSSALCVSNNYSPPSTSNLFNALWPVCLASLTVITFIQFLIQMRNSKNIPKFLNAINGFDQKVRKFQF